MMQIGICKITLRIPSGQSLKNKRRIIKSLIDKIDHRFNVSVAEIEHHDQWRIATLGIAYVSNDSRRVNQVLSQIMELISSSQGDFVITDHQQEIIKGI